MCSRYGSVIMHTRPYERRLRDVIKVIFYYGDKKKKKKKKKKKTAFQIYRNRVVSVTFVK